MQSLGYIVSGQRRPRCQLESTMGKKSKSPSNNNNNDDDGHNYNNMMLSSMPREPPPLFQCGEFLEEQQEVHDYGRTVSFFCTLPREKDDVDDDNSNPRLTFHCRDRSVGVLNDQESKLTNSDMEETEEDTAVDPNFFQQGYTLAGRTGFQVWAATRLMVESLLFPLDSDCDRLTTIQREIQSSKKRILELGSGVGVVSLSIAASTGSQVLLTDLPALVEQSLLPNLKLNQRTSIDKTDLSSSQLPPQWLYEASRDLEFEEEEDNENIVFPIGDKGGWASIAVVDWTMPLNSQVSKVAPMIDYIIASDCVWLVSMMDSLLDTVHAIFQANPLARLLLSFKRRDGTDSTMFTKVDSVVEAVKARGWSLECLAWRYATSEDNEGTKEVYLLEIAPSSA